MEEEQNSKSPTSLKTLLIVALLIVLVLYVTLGWKKSKKVQLTLDELAPSQQLQIITDIEMKKVPEISSEKSIVFEDLPVYLKGLSNDQAEDFSAKSIVYVDGTTGFGIEYTAPDTLKNTYILFHTNSKTQWPPLDGGRTAGAAFLNIEHEAYFIQAKFLKVEDTKTSVQVMVIKK